VKTLFLFSIAFSVGSFFPLFADQVNKSPPVLLWSAPQVDRGSGSLVQAYESTDRVVAFETHESLPGDSGNFLGGLTIGEQWMFRLDEEGDERVAMRSLLFQALPQPQDKQTLLLGVLDWSWRSKRLLRFALTDSFGEWIETKKSDYQIPDERMPEPLKYLYDNLKAGTQAARVGEETALQPIPGLMSRSFARHLLRLAPIPVKAPEAKVQITTTFFRPYDADGVLGESRVRVDSQYFVDGQMVESDNYYFNTQFVKIPQHEVSELLAESLPCAKMMNAMAHFEGTRK
jgi:hypothetical protein